jgi:hypothetical protein
MSKWENAITQILENLEYYSIDEIQVLQASIEAEIQFRSV